MMLDPFMMVQLVYLRRLAYPAESVAQLFKGVRVDVAKAMRAIAALEIASGKDPKDYETSADYTAAIEAIAAEIEA